VDTISQLINAGVRVNIRAMSHWYENPSVWGYILNAVGLLVGIVGIGIAVRSNQKLQGARAAKRATQNKLFCHIAAEQFNEMSRTAVEIELLLRSNNREPVPRLATELQLSLGNALGSWTQLLRGPEIDKIEVATKNIVRILELLPLGGFEAQLQEDRLQEIIGFGRFISAVTAEIAGRLRVENLIEREEG
jgi:hypothetical protein